MVFTRLIAIANVFELRLKKRLKSRSSFIWNWWKITLYYLFTSRLWIISTNDFWILFSAYLSTYTYLYIYLRISMRGLIDRADTRIRRSGYLSRRSFLLFSQGWSVCIRKRSSRGTSQSDFLEYCPLMSLLNKLKFWVSVLFRDRPIRPSVSLPLARPRAEFSSWKAARTGKTANAANSFVAGISNDGKPTSPSHAFLQKTRNLWK